MACPINKTQYVVEGFRDDLIQLADQLRGQVRHPIRTPAKLGNRAAVFDFQEVQRNALVEPIGNPFAAGMGLKPPIPSASDKQIAERRKVAKHSRRKTPARESGAHVTQLNHSIFSFQDRAPRVPFRQSAHTS